MLDIKINKVNILGTEYSIEFKDLKDDDYAKKENVAGYCDELTKKIVIINYNSFEDTKNCDIEMCKYSEKWTLRHELYHAFFNESGLSNCSLTLTGCWAKNEEMIDWLAIQSPKIFKLFNELDIL